MGGLSCTHSHVPRQGGSSTGSKPSGPQLEPVCTQWEAGGQHGRPQPGGTLAVGLPANCWSEDFHCHAWEPARDHAVHTEAVDGIY